MKLSLTLILLVLSMFSIAQTTINGTLVHDGLSRTYILYVPASYSAGTPAPLVFNFHGYTSNSTEQIYYGEFRPIADTAGFILVVPQGTLDGNGDTYWNAGWGGAADDIGFTEALIDSLSNAYNINQNRVYSTGMSNGGYMSYYLACNLSDRIAAIASVTGTMTTGTNNSCSAQHATPVMEIHGTADATVPYNGNAIGLSTTAVMNHWAGYNNTNSSPSMINVPNTNTGDGCTAEHYIYEDGDNCVEVEHYKIIGGGHTWPGAPIDIGVTNHDFDASSVIWQFFNKYDINGKINCVATSINEEKELDFNAYPNPFSNEITIDLKDNSISKIKLTNIVGQTMLETLVSNGQSYVTVSTADLPSGTYLLVIENANHNKLSSKIVVKG